LLFLITKISLPSRARTVIIYDSLSLPGQPARIAPLNEQTGRQLHVFRNPPDFSQFSSNFPPLLFLKTGKLIHRISNK
jgi:hypothetical protein